MNMRCSACRGVDAAAARVAARAVVVVALALMPPWTQEDN
jgi:hypothetical protein